jgi:DNA-binding winged helix-turn-helix (wHTH) protein
MQFTFDDHTLDTERRELLRGGAVIAVQPQVFDLLVYLVQNREHVVSKDDLIALVWQGRIVSDSTLTSRINAARTVIGDSGKDQKLIRTIPRKGVRFVGSVIEQLGDTQPAAAPVREIRRLRHCPNGRRSLCSPSPT